MSPSPTSAPDEKVLVRRKDPWQLYAKEEDSRIVRWGKKEAVQEKLADRALGIELSRHLVKTFFQAVHFSYPVSDIFMVPGIVKLTLLGYLTGIILPRMDASRTEVRSNDTGPRSTVFSD